MARKLIGDAIRNILARTRSQLHSSRTGFKDRYLLGDMSQSRAIPIAGSRNRQSDEMVWTSLDMPALMMALALKVCAVKVRIEAMIAPPQNNRIRRSACVPPE